MNYQKIYNQFISDRLNKVPVGYCEKHHIFPKSLGGSNDKSNLIKLTPQDHYFAHELLAKIYGGKMSNALWMMTTSKKYKKSRVIYEQSKNKQALIVSNIKYWSGKSRTKETCEKISKTLMGRFCGKNSPFYKRKISDEERKRLSEISKKRALEFGGPMKGKKHKPESLQKLRDYMLSDKNHFRGKKKSAEHSKKIGDAQIGIKNHAFKHNVFEFYNENGDIFIGYQNDFYKKFKLTKSCVSRLVTGKVKKTKTGWGVKCH
jgi:hypothetical protein